MSILPPIRQIRFCIPGLPIIWLDVCRNIKTVWLKDLPKNIKYQIKKLVFYEIFNNPEDAIRAEKKIKGWTRKKKMALIKSKNPEFKNLLDDL